MFRKMIFIMGVLSCSSGFAEELTFEPASAEEGVPVKLSWRLVAPEPNTVCHLQGDVSGQKSVALVSDILLNPKSSLKAILTCVSYNTLGSKNSRDWIWNSFSLEGKFNLEPTIEIYYPNYVAPWDPHELIISTKNAKSCMFSDDLSNSPSRWEPLTTNYYKERHAYGNLTSANEHRIIKVKCNSDSGQEKIVSKPFMVAPKEAAPKPIEAKIISFQAVDRYTGRGDLYLQWDTAGMVACSMNRQVKNRLTNQVGPWEAHYNVPTSTSSYSVTVAQHTETNFVLKCKNTKDILFSKSITILRGAPTCNFTCGVGKHDDMAPIMSENNSSESLENGNNGLFNGLPGYIDVRVFPLNESNDFARLHLNNSTNELTVYLVNDLNGSSVVQQVVGGVYNFEQVAYIQFDETSKNITVITKDSDGLLSQ